MFHIDKTVLDTHGKILFNISEQLAELIMLLKPHEVEEVKEVKKYKCKKCGQEFDTPQRVAIHTKNCKELI